MQPNQISYEQAILFVTLINIILGFLFGIFPLLAGIALNNRKFGVYGFIGAVIGGAVLGIFLSFPIALILTWLIVKKSTAKEDVAVVNETPAEINIDNTENR
jgi:voltage-gated potassium channel Kch